MKKIFIRWIKTGKNNNIGCDFIFINSSSEIIKLNKPTSLLLLKVMQKNLKDVVEMIEAKNVIMIIKWKKIQSVYNK